MLRRRVNFDKKRPANGMVYAIAKIPLVHLLSPNVVVVVVVVVDVVIVSGRVKMKHGYGICLR